jgi:hypothetical protein
MQASDSNTDDVAGINTITSGGNVNIEGGVYMPEQTFTIHANGDMNQTSNYFPIIAKKFEMGGTATLFVNLDWEAAGFPAPDSPKPRLSSPNDKCRRTGVPARRGARMGFLSDLTTGTWQAKPPPFRVRPMKPFFVQIKPIWQGL